jgi:ElaB/YqjD/DUF883 family membrane-anchored ribosome-binding protein
MSNLSNAASESVKDARDAIRESGAAASAASADIAADLKALREDVGRLAAQIGDIFAAKGNKVWQRTRASVDEAMTDAQGAKAEAIDAVREVGDNVLGAIDDSLEQRPYTTLALAFGIGFLFGAMGRR